MLGTKFYPNLMLGFSNGVEKEEYICMLLYAKEMENTIFPSY